MNTSEQVVVARVARRLINGGGIEELRHLHGMNESELELLAEREESTALSFWLGTRERAS